MRIPKSGIRLAAAAILAHLLVPAPCFGQKDEIEAGIARARKLSSALKLGAGEAEALANRLLCADEALQSGQLFLSLRRLQSPSVDLGMYAYRDEKKAVAGAGVPAFEREWRRLGEELRAKEKRILADAGRRLPAAVLALAQASRLQSGPYHVSGRLYGLNTTLDDGLLYMGLARGHLDFALFCDSLPLRETRPLPKWPSLAPRLTQLESRVVEAYGRAGEKERSKYLGLNSTLKMASELSKRGWAEGALYEYLEAALSFGLLGTPETTPDRAASLGADIASFSERLRSDAADHSIGLLYTQVAQSALAGGCAGVTDETAYAAAIVDHVLPRYLDYVSVKP